MVGGAEGLIFDIDILISFTIIHKVKTTVLLSISWAIRIFIRYDHAAVLLVKVLLDSELLMD